MVDLAVDGDPNDLYFKSDPEAFYLEIFVRYHAARQPRGVTSAEAAGLYVGRDDWTVRYGQGEGVIREVGPLAMDLVGPQPPLFISAYDLTSTPLEGWLVFAVPREAADGPIELAYEPPVLNVPAWTVTVREAGEPPEHVPALTPPSAPAYVAVAGRPFAVSESSAADALFESTNTCTNPVAGYTLTYPESWFTNASIGETPACSWFSPLFFDVKGTSMPPAQVVIGMTYVAETGGIGPAGHPLRSEELEVAGRPAFRKEEVGVGGGFITIGAFRYGYDIAPDGRFPDERESASVLIASTEWLPDGDVEQYVLNRGVLDRIMASMEFAVP